MLNTQKELNKIIEGPCNSMGIQKSFRKKLETDAVSNFQAHFNSSCFDMLARFNSISKYKDQPVYKEKCTYGSSKGSFTDGSHRENGTEAVVYGAAPRVVPSRILIGYGLKSREADVENLGRMYKRNFICRATLKALNNPKKTSQLVIEF